MNNIEAWMRQIWVAELGGARRWIACNAVVCLAAILVVDDRLVSAQCTATRMLPVDYEPGTPLVVVIDVVTDGSVLVWSIEESPPAGWTVRNINDSGVFAGGQVRWLSFSGQSTTLMYEVTPPVEATEAQRFNGVIGVNADPLMSICGDMVLTPSCLHGVAPPCLDPTMPTVVARTPMPNQVVNRIPGVHEVVVQFDQAIPSSTIEIRGIRGGQITSGVMLGQGTDTHRRLFPTPLPDRDRYIVTVRAGTLSVEWEFVALIGDCNRDRIVDIFDLGQVRIALRNNVFDMHCDIQPDDVINIFDLGHVRRALQSGAVAP